VLQISPLTGELGQILNEKFQRFLYRIKGITQNVVTSRLRAA
jgi:hypothetical protein